MGLGGTGLATDDSRFVGFYAHGYEVWSAVVVIVDIVRSALTALEGQSAGDRPTIQAYIGITS